jgi:hypothetical protein
MEVGGQRHNPSNFYPKERPGAHCIGGWVVPRVVLDGCGIIIIINCKWVDTGGSGQFTYYICMDYEG